jgi:hypothetical protein
MSLCLPCCVDWFRVIRDLRYEAGLDCTAIAHALHVGKRTPNTWANGVEPGYAKGEALLTLYREKLHREPPRLERQNLAARP